MSSGRVRQRARFLHDNKSMCQHDSEQTGQLLADTCHYVYVYINVHSGLGTQKLQAFQAAWERPHRIPMVQNMLGLPALVSRYS